MRSAAGTNASTHARTPGRDRRTPRTRCSCGTPTKPGLVLDPFMGAGTVAIAAEANRRDWLGIELNPAFARLAEKRIERARAQRSYDENEAAAVAA